jgi:hypothetical protein
MSIMTESQTKDLTAAIAANLWTWHPELLNTNESKNYYKLVQAILEVIESEVKHYAEGQTKPNPQGYNIFGNPKPLRLLSEVKS